MPPSNQFPAPEVTHAAPFQKPEPESKERLSTEDIEKFDNGEKQTTGPEEKEKADESRETSSTPSRCPSVQMEREVEVRDERRTIVSFTPNDPANPYNWSTPKKCYVVAASAILVLNSTVRISRRRTLID
jgi:hypothetical protein